MYGRRVLWHSCYHRSFVEDAVLTSAFLHLRYTSSSTMIRCFVVVSEMTVMLKEMVSMTSTAPLHWDAHTVLSRCRPR